MNEAGKTLAAWSDSERALLVGRGIDIGCGPWPVVPGAMPFDLANGDANHITRHVSGQFDYVFSSHCLEHMEDPRAALLEWWRLVAPGGVLIVLVPDEDLYEQGHWPSRYNSDHKWTFTISKAKSWSPRSVNMLEIYEWFRRDLRGEPVALSIQDQGYNRGLRDVDQTRGGALAQIQFIVRKQKENHER